MKRSVFLVGLSLLCATGLAEPPKLVKSEPGDGTTDVKVDIGVVRLQFDRDMKTDSWTFWNSDKGELPPLESPEQSPWLDARSPEIKIRKLKPNATYAIQLNSTRRQGFRSAEDDTPLPVTTIAFQTGAEAPVEAEAVETPPEPPAPAEEGGKRCAFVIGISEYKLLAPLRFSAADARLMYKTLCENAGYEKTSVILLADDQADEKDKPTFANIRDRLRPFLKSLRSHDTAVVFFSGHAVKDGKGQAFLAASDTNPDNRDDTSVFVGDLKSALEECAAEKKVLILDVCHASTAEGSRLDEAIAVSAEAVLEQVQSDAFVTVVSCSAGQKSHSTEPLKHDVFAYLLAEGLQGKADGNKDGAVTLDELFGYARDKTKLYVEVVLSKEQQPSRAPETGGETVLAGAEPGRTLIVPDAHKTIVAAIEAARPGDIVQVKPGVYRESIVFKNGVKLVGVDRDKCRLEVPDDAKALLLAEGCQSGSIANLTLDGRGISSGNDLPDGIVLSDSVLEISNCVVEKFRGARIWVKGQKSSPTLRENICRTNMNH